MRIKTTIFLALLLTLPILANAQPGRPIIESLSFAPLPVGARADKEVRIGNLVGLGEYVVIDSCDGPYTMATQRRDLVIAGGEVRIKVSFEPTVPGSFKDEIVLRRTVATFPTNDTIRIRLFGTAFRVDRTDKVEFGEVLTGDLSNRRVIVRAELNENVRWQVIGTLDEPFQLVNRNGPVLVGGDSLAFGLVFQPQREGTFTDTVGLVRLHISNGKPLDTINVYFNGIGLRMPSEKIVVFNKMIVGATRKDTLMVDLPVAPRNKSFVYSIEPNITQGVVSARFLSSAGPTKDQRIRIEFTCAPTAFAESGYGFVLLRSRFGEAVVDSTTIVVNVTMVPRPIQLSMGFTADTFYHRIGDTVSFDVMAITRDPIDLPLALESFVCDITYNPTMLVPILTGTQQRSVVDEQPVLNLGETGLNGSKIIGSNVQVIAQARFVVVLGDADRTPLSITKCAITRQDNQTQTLQPTTSMVLVTNVWRYQDGRPRYVNTLQGVLVADVDPNPVVSQSTLHIRNVPTQGGRLVVIDALGQIRVDLTSALRAESREFSISSSGLADIVLAPGSYYAQLLVEGAAGGTINSVVRLFVVQ